MVLTSTALYPIRFTLGRTVSLNSKNVHTLASLEPKPAQTLKGGEKQLGKAYTSRQLGCKKQK